MISFLKQKTFLDFFPTPEFLLLSTAGVAIADENIKFVQLRSEMMAGGLKLAHLSIVDLPLGTLESGLVNNPTEFISALRKIATHCHTRYVHAALPEEKAYLFTASIGRVPPEGLRDAVAFIIEENVPITLAESVFDFEIIGETAHAHEIKLAVTVLPKNIVNTYIELFESAGITPISFDTESQAIARAIIRRGDKRTYLIVNLTLNKTGFYIVEEEVVQFSTTSAYGIGQDSSYPNFDDLRSEMRKVLTFWNTRTDPHHQDSNEVSASKVSGKKVEKILLCGFGSGQEDFVEKLMEGSEVEYTLSNVWSNTSSTNSRIPEISFKGSLEYASAVGLALPRGR